MHRSLTEDSEPEVERDDDDVSERGKNSAVPQIAGTPTEYKL
jgi:hypothetical protein